MSDIHVVSPKELEEQRPYIEKVRAYYAAQKELSKPLAFVRTYGCQQNVSDSERM